MKFSFSKAVGQQAVIVLTKTPSLFAMAVLQFRRYNYFSKLLWIIASPVLTLMIVTPQQLKFDNSNTTAKDIENLLKFPE